MAYATSQSPASVHPAQHGFALVVGLILLLVLTILGLAAAQSTALEEKMAANQRNHELAFEAAAAALRAAEGGLRTGLWSNFSANTGGLYAVNPGSLPTTQLWDTSVWTSGTGTLDYQNVAGTAFPGVSQQPLFIIEQMPPAPLNGINLGQAQFGGPPITIQLYRITALGTGGDSSSQVMLQSIYRP